MMRVAVRSSGVGAAPVAGPVTPVNPAQLGNYPRLALPFGRRSKTNEDYKNLQANYQQSRSTSRTSIPAEPSMLC